MNDEPIDPERVSQDWLAAARKRTATFELATGRLQVGAADLEKIQATVVPHIRSSEILEREQLASEIERGVCIVDSDGVPRIGGWILENRRGSMALVRQPPRSKVMRFFVIHLSKEDRGNWTVLSSGEQRVRAN